MINLEACQICHASITKQIGDFLFSCSTDFVILTFNFYQAKKLQKVESCFSLFLCLPAAPFVEGSEVVNKVIFPLRLYTFIHSPIYSRLKQYGCFPWYMFYQDLAFPAFKYKQVNCSNWKLKRKCCNIDIRFIKV